MAEQQQNTGSYVATTNVWDVSRLYEVEIGSEEFKELIVRLYQNVNNIALVLNTKDSGFYLLEEFLTGQVWFNPADTNPLKTRPVYRRVVNTGALGAGVTTVVHGLTPGNTWTFTKIQGAASNTGTLAYVPLPYAGVGVGNISVDVNSTNVVINNGSGSTFTNSYIILEYLKF